MTLTVFSWNIERPYPFLLHQELTISFLRRVREADIDLAWSVIDFSLTALPFVLLSSSWMEFKIKCYPWILEVKIQAAKGLWKKQQVGVWPGPCWPIYFSPKQFDIPYYRMKIYSELQCKLATWPRIRKILKFKFKQIFKISNLAN